MRSGTGDEMKEVRERGMLRGERRRSRREGGTGAAGDDTKPLPAGQEDHSILRHMLIVAAVISHDTAA